MAETKREAGSVPTHPAVPNEDAEPVKEADKSSGPYIFDAETNDAPLRSGSPQEPLVGTLTKGAGQHMPETDPHFGTDGRWYATVELARSSSGGVLTEEELDARYGKQKAPAAETHPQAK